MFCVELCLNCIEENEQLFFFLPSADQYRYYNAAFLITNIQYDTRYERQTTEEFRYLSQEIENMVS